MKITIKDIAKMANVSVATVSRVVNNHPQGVSENKRAEILKLVEEYEYTPNLIAKSMVTNKTECIGLLIPDILNPFFQNLARGIEDYAMQQGYSVFLCNTDNQPSKYLNYVKAMRSKNVDGLIITGYPPEIADEVGKLLAKAKVVIIDRYIEESNYCQITTDNFTAAYQMTDYLIEMGHKQIACITGVKDLYINDERIRGYQRALEKHDIPYDEGLMFEGDFQLASGEYNTELILNSTSATAIFCFNDMMAQGAYKTCKKLGKSIPEDISVVGFDDIYVAELMNPPLTTVSQKSYKMGNMASRILIDWTKEDELEQKHITLANKLVKRESVKRL